MDVVLHSDEALEQELSGQIAERDTVHAWPLSCVQRVVLDDGRTYAYKSQLPPTVEDRFYAAATSELLPGHRVLDPLGGCVTMAFDWLEGLPLSALHHNELQLVAHGRRVTGAIAGIEGDLPVHVDLGTPAAWTAAAQLTLERLDRLVASGRFTATDADAVGFLRDWSEDPDTVAAVTTGARTIHGDLTLDQVFVGPVGRQHVVDWQRPVIALPEVDLCGLLLSAGIDPRRHVRLPAIASFWFLRLHWAAEAATEYLPALAGGLLDRWSAEALRHVRSASQR